MGYTALYRKFRPMVFEEVVGQDAITRTLRNQIIANRVGHAYLLNGGRGTGKTSSAKILARAINCLNPKDGNPCNECEICKGAISGSLTDIVEMDAASNNSVEDIRSIREEVNFLPTKAKYRVYIIDEVHMLSTGAFNALLKTLEEPPEHVKFILATTEPQKLPATILSRCQRFDFKRIPNEDIKNRLKVVCKESQIEITDGALMIIASLSEGAMRDALSILERCIQDGVNKIDEDKIKDLVGIPKITFVHNLVKAVIDYDVMSALQQMENVLNEGKDLENFLWELIKYIKDVLLYQSGCTLDLYNEDELKNIKELSDKVSKERFVQLVYAFSEIQNQIKWSTQKNILFQTGIIKLCSKEIGIESVLEERVKKIEDYLKSGNITTKFVQTTANSANFYANIPITSSNVSQNKGMQSNSTNAKKAMTSSIQGNVKNIETSWPTIVNDLKQNGRIVLFTNLVSSTAKQINDMTVGIQFPKGVTSFGKTVLEKTENIAELKRLVSMAYGKDMEIKYLMEPINTVPEKTPEQDIQSLAKESDIPFQVIE